MQYVEGAQPFSGGPEAVYFDTYPLDRLISMNRTEIGTGGGVLTSTSGIVNYCYFTAVRSIRAKSIATWSGSTAAATPTSCLMGVYQEEGNGNLTLLGATANDTAVWSVAETRYERNFTAQFDMKKGRRYATATLFVGTTPPTLVGFAATSVYDTPATAIWFLTPRLTGQNLSETALVGTVPAADIVGQVGRIYAEVIPV